MKQCLLFRWRVILYAWWLPLLLLIMSVFMGVEATASLNDNLHRVGTSNAREALAYVMDIRHFFPLAGAVWSAAYFGMEIDGKSASVLLKKGYTHLSVIVSNYALFLVGLVSVSVIEQAFILILNTRLFASLTPAFLLRTVLLRLVLDLGMMSAVSFFPFLGKGSAYARFLGLVYGIALWRLMGNHYCLWLPELGMHLGLGELWPLGTLVFGVVGYLVSSIRFQQFSL